jgi:response regulator NasT
VGRSATVERATPCVDGPAAAMRDNRRRCRRCAGRRRVVEVSQKGTVLVVDDNRLVLATLADGLTRAGYDVIDADNGDDAILLARQHRPDLALLDIRMEGKSGFDVAAYLRTYCHMPFMFLSAFSDEETVSKVKALGAVDYLVKPIDVGRIVPAVDAAFASLQAARPQAGLAASEASPRAGALRPVAGAAAATEPLAGVVAMAAGVLMHRYSIARAEALARLRALAEAEQRPLAEQAERVLDAVEELARGAAPAA